MTMKTMFALALAAILGIGALTATASAYQSCTTTCNGGGGYRTCTRSCF
jgi:hypothetical protein